MDKIALDSDVGETWMMRRAKDTRTETIAIYLLAFMVLFSLVLLMVWGFSISDTRRLSTILVNDRHCFSWTMCDERYVKQSAVTAASILLTDKAGRHHC